MTSFEKNLRFSIGSIIGNSPFLFSINYLRGKFKDRIVQADSELCIEGFQRSGNSNFFILFKHKNRQVKIAHHIHGSAHVKRAIENGVPTLVLIRQPGDALASLLSWDKKLKPKIAIKAYINFYQQLMDVKSKVLIADFEESTNNIAGIVNKLNERFHKDFVIPDYSETELKQIKENISSRQDTFSSAFPNEKRAKLNEENKLIIKSHPLFSKAQQVYNAFLS